MLKINPITLIITAFLYFGFNCSAQNTDNKDINYKIEITNFYFGRKDHVTLLTNSVIKSETNHVRGKPKFYSRKLTNSEVKRITDFLDNFPISNLKNEYVNSRVEDGTQISFRIKIDETEKSVFVANAFQKDLAGLVALIVPLLPNDYIAYNKEHVPWEAD